METSKVIAAQNLDGYCFRDVPAIADGYTSRTADGVTYFCTSTKVLGGRVWMALLAALGIEMILEAKAEVVVYEAAATLPALLGCDGR